MIYRILADIIVIIHLVFILFVCLGAILAYRWPRIAWVHLPCAIWGAIVEFFHLICPLTPLENYLRKLGGVSVYQSDFIEKYILPIIYPESLTSEKQFVFGVSVVVVNLVIYGLLRLKKRRSRNDR